MTILLSKKDNNYLPVCCKNIYSGIDFKLKIINDGMKTKLFSLDNIPKEMVIANYCGNQESVFKIKKNILITSIKETDLFGKMAHVIKHPNGTFINPTDNNGNILEQFCMCPLLYVREPFKNEKSNCKLIFDDNNIFLKTKKDINKNEEILVCLRPWNIR